jgi:hypothetical protein
VPPNFELLRFVNSFVAHVPAQPVPFIPFPKIGTIGRNKHVAVGCLFWFDLIFDQVEIDVVVIAFLLVLASAV